MTNLENNINPKIYCYQCCGFSPLNPSGIIFRCETSMEQVFDFATEYPEYEIDVNVFEYGEVRQDKNWVSIDMNHKPEFKFTLNSKNAESN